MWGFSVCGCVGVWRVTHALAVGVCVTLCVLESYHDCVRLRWQPLDHFFTLDPAVAGDYAGKPLPDEFYK